MNVYLVTLVDAVTGEMQLILVESGCPHDMQEFVDRIGDLRISHPRVVDVSPSEAARYRIVDRAG